MVGVLANDDGLSFTLRAPEDIVVSPSKAADPLLLGVREMSTQRNVFFDKGALAYYIAAGGVLPPTPFAKRKVLAASVWYVETCGYRL